MDKDGAEDRGPWEGKGYRGLWAFYSEGGLPDRAEQEWLFTVCKRLSEMKSRALGLWVLGLQGWAWVGR